MEFTWFSFLISTLIKHMQHSVTSSSGRPHRHRVMHRVSKFSLASERLSPGNRDLSHILRAASWPNVGSCPRREEGMPVGTRPWPITTHHTEDIHMLSGCRCGCNGASFSSATHDAARAAALPVCGVIRRAYARARGWAAAIIASGIATRVALSQARDRRRALAASVPTSRVGHTLGTPADDDQPRA